MKYKLEYIELALEDVEGIRDHLSQFYPSTPEKFLKALKKGIESLSDNPFLYAEYEENTAYRKMVVLDYLVFYKVFEQEGIVEINRVLNGMRDIKAYLP